MANSRFDLDKFYKDPIDEFLDGIDSVPASQIEVAPVSTLFAGNGTPPNSFNSSSTLEELIAPAVQALTPVQRERLLHLQRRKERLQPVEIGGLGGSRIPNNPYSIDTTQLLSGLGAVAEAIINKERRQRLAEINPELSKLLARRDALKVKSKDGPGIKTYRTNKRIYKAALKLIANDAIQPGLKMLHNAGFDTAEIIQALPGNDASKAKALKKEVEKAVKPPQNEQPLNGSEINSPVESSAKSVKANESAINNNPTGIPPVVKEKPTTRDELKKDLNFLQKLLKNWKDSGKPLSSFDFNGAIQSWKNSGRV